MRFPFHIPSASSQSEGREGSAFFGTYSRLGVDLFFEKRLLFARVLGQDSQAKPPPLEEVARADGEMVDTLALMLCGTSPLPLLALRSSKEPGHARENILQLRQRIDRESDSPEQGERSRRPGANNGASRRRRGANASSESLSLISNAREKERLSTFRPR